MRPIGDTYMFNVILQASNKMISETNIHLVISYALWSDFF